MSTHWRLINRRKPVLVAIMTGLVAIGLVFAPARYFSVASAQDHPAVLQFPSTAQYRCEPTEPRFCANVHIGCSGQSPLRTFDFVLWLTDDTASLTSTDDSNSVASDLAKGRLTRDETGAYVIYRPQQRRDYIKILADGSFSFRHYARHGTLMTYGRCRLNAQPQPQ